MVDLEFLRLEGFQQASSNLLELGDGFLVQVGLLEDIE